MINIHESPLDFPPKGSSWAFELTMQIFKQFLSHINNTSIAIPKNIDKINHFFEYLRTEYLVNTSKRDTAFIKKVSDKSGNTLETTTKLIEEIESLLRKPVINQEELLGLNKRIESFKNTKYGS